MVPDNDARRSARRLFHEARSLDDRWIAGRGLQGFHGREAGFNKVREFIVQAPEELTGFFAFLTVPPGPPFPEPLHFQKMCAIVWSYNGPLDQANEILEPLRSFRPPAKSA